MRLYMSSLGFSPSMGDSEVWMRKAETSEGKKYWEYVLLNVDDCLVISHRGEHVLQNKIRKKFILKDSSIGPPNIYLGKKV